MYDDYGDPAPVRPGADFEQYTGETLDYVFEWSGRLDGDTIANSDLATPDGGTLSSESNTTSAVTVFFTASAGTYRLTNTITTAGGRTLEATIRIVVTES